MKKVNQFLFPVILFFSLQLFHPLFSYAQNTESAKIQEARKDIKDDPDDSNVHYNLGLALMRSIETSLRAQKGLTVSEQKVADEAEVSYKKALSLSNNTHGRAAIMLGMLYQFQGKYEAGIPYAKIGLELPPDSQDYAIAAGVLAVCYSETSRKEEALEVVKEALKYHNDNATLNEYFRILSTQTAETNTAVYTPTDPKQKKAMEWGAELQKQMEAILNSSESAEVQQKKVAKAQEDYQKKIKELYGQK